MSGPPLLDEDRIDMEALLDRYERADIYASDYWLDDIESKIEVDNDTYAFTDVGYDDEQEWLADRLLALFIESQRHTDIGVLEFVGAMQSIEENVQTTAGVALNRYAEAEGYDLKSGYVIDDLEDE